MFRTVQRHLKQDVVFRTTRPQVPIRPRASEERGPPGPGGQGLRDQVPEDPQGPERGARNPKETQGGSQWEAQCEKHEIAQIKLRLFIKTGKTHKQNEGLMDPRGSQMEAKASISAARCVLHWI